MVAFQLWDCPGSMELEDLGVPLSYFQSIIFVLDIQVRMALWALYAAARGPITKRSLRSLSHRAVSPSPETLGQPARYWKRRPPFATHSTLQDDYYSPIAHLVHLIATVAQVNPKVHLEVFVHKAEALSDEFKVGEYVFR